MVLGVICECVQSCSGEIRLQYGLLRMGLIERHGHDWIVKRAGVGMSCRRLRNRRFCMQNAQVD